MFDARGDAEWTLLETAAFEREFQRCCREYLSLDFAVAWAGNPKRIVPFGYLESLGRINGVVGVALCQTHPDAISKLSKLTSLRIFRSDLELFHPKIFLFRSGQKFAL